MHALANLTIYAVPKQTKFFDEDGYEIIPMQMITKVQKEEPSNEKFYEINNEVIFGDMVSIRDVSNSDYGIADNGDKRRLMGLVQMDMTLMKL